MKTLLQQLQVELHGIFIHYEQSKHIPLVHNAECIAWLKTTIAKATCALILIKTLPTAIDKLDTRFWSFLPFVDDPIRHLKENLLNVLKQKRYAETHVLQVESIELRSENAELTKRMAALEKTLADQKTFLLKVPNEATSHPTEHLSEEALFAQIRFEVEQEIKIKMEELRQQKQKLQAENKHLTLKCDAFKKQTVAAVFAKEQAEQTLSTTQQELTSIKEAFKNAQAEIMRLAEENRLLRQTLPPSKSKHSKADMNAIELAETTPTKSAQLV